MSATTEKKAAPKRAASATKSAPKAAPKKAPKRKSPYSDRVRAMSKMANETRSNGGSFRIGPKQASIALATLERETDGPLTEAEVLLLCGVKSTRALRDVATGKAETKPLRPLAAKVKQAHADPYASSPRWLAALALAAVETLPGT